MAAVMTTVKEALAAQISAYFAANGGRQTNVRPYRSVSTYPCITMAITDLVPFGTMGPAGIAEVQLMVTIHVNSADPDSDEIAMDDYMSVGVGNGSSVIDAINSDHTLGGVVENVTALEVRAPVDTPNDYAADVPLMVLLRKVGAQT
jgi:hypothetical protein